jgi:hypothetical protein
MNAKYLLRQYVDTGASIPESQFKKLNYNLKKTYLRKRLIAFEHTNKISWEINYLPYHTQLEMIKTNEDVFSQIKNPTKEMELEIVMSNWKRIKNIKNPTEDLQLAAIKQSIYAIDFIKNPTELVQFETVKQNPDAIRGIRNPTERVKQYVKNQTKLIEEIQKIKKLLI